MIQGRIFAIKSSIGCFSCKEYGVFIIINKCLVMKSSKKGKNNYKYNKITQQKKFHLLNLVLGEKMLIKDAAKIVGINYSTAKTIMFFNRNGDKSYLFEFQKQDPEPYHPPLLQCGVYDLTLKQEEGQSPTSLNSIDIVSTIGFKKSNLQRMKQEKNLSSNPFFSFSNKKFLSHLNDPINSDLLKQEQNGVQKQGFSFFQGHPMTRSRTALLKQNGNCKIQEPSDSQSIRNMNYR